MTDKVSEQGGTLHLSRELYVPRDLVFDVWTDPKHLSQWYGPEGAQVKASVRGRDRGASFEFSWKDARGEPVREWGEFARFEPPAEFECTLNHAAHRQWRSRLRVRLVDQGGACCIELEQQGVPDEIMQANRQAWEARLNRLEAYFSVI